MSLWLFLSLCYCCDAFSFNFWSHTQESQHTQPTTITTHTQALFTVDTQLEQRLKQGHDQIRFFEDSPSCWTDINVSMLQEQCNNLDYNNRARIAITITNCHLDLSGRKTIECNTHMDVKQCALAYNNDDVAFSAYTVFFAHVDNICFYLSSSNFKQSTEDAINNLLSSTINVADNLKTFHEQSIHISDNINQIISSQEQLHTKSSLIDAKLDTSLENEHLLLHEQELVYDHIQILHREHGKMSDNIHIASTQMNAFATNMYENLDRLSNQERETSTHLSLLLELISEKVTSVLQFDILILLEIFAFKSILFYIILFVMTLVFTSFKRTSRARFPVLILFVFNVFIEQFVLAKLISVDSPDKYFEFCAHQRKIVVFLSLFIIIRSYKLFVDINELNRTLLIRVLDQKQHAQRYTHRRRSIRFGFHKLKNE